MKLNIRILIIVCIVATGVINAQSVTDVPAGVTNDRFAQEYFPTIKRPGLSVNGFDNGGDDSKGLGLKQVLNETLSGNLYLKAKLNEIFDRARDNFYYSEPTQSQIETNSRILQYTAFEALASYVLEQNNIDSVMSRSQGLNIRSHAVAVADLRQKMLFIANDPILSYPFEYPFLPYYPPTINMVTTRKDYVNNVKSYQNIARAMDLYLALENAYKYWDYAEWSGDALNFL